MHTFPIILLIFLVGCGGEYDTAEFVWEQKADSTKTVLDKALKTEWMEKQGKELMAKAKQFYHDKLHKEKEETIILNTNAPEWTVSDWLNSQPLTLNELHGKVVLIRWWTGPTCPYCINSAAALNEFYETYKNENINVSIYNINGQLVSQLYNGHQNAGYHQLEFDGDVMSSGMYFIQFRIWDLDQNLQFNENQKILLVK